MKAKTFVELEQAKNVTFEELSASLEDYTAGGWSIASQVVKKIVDKVNPSIEELDALIKSASKGFDGQSKRGQVKAADEYQDLLYHLQSKSATKMGV